MTLSEYLKIYVLEHDLSPSTIEGYENAVHCFEKWHGKPIEIETELTTDLVNGFLAWMKEAGRSPYTIKSRRSTLLVFWRAIQADSRIDFTLSCDSVRTVKTHELDPECYTLEQAGQLLTYCKTLTGMVGSLKIPRSLYYASFVAAAWDSGLRLGDLLDFDTATVAGIAANGGAVRILQNKSGRFVECYFHQSTIQAMQDCLDCCPRTSAMFAPYPNAAKIMGPPDRRHLLPTDRVWPKWANHRRSWHKAFAEVVAGAGLEGATKYLRRGAATEAEFLTPGTAARKLGHSPNSVGLAEKHYISRKVLPMAPVIGRELSA